MNGGGWDPNGPLPGTDPEEELRFRQFVQLVYFDIDRSEHVLRYAEGLVDGIDRRARPALWGFVLRCLATRKAILEDYDGSAAYVDLALSVVTIRDDATLYLLLLNIRAMLHKFRGHHGDAIETLRAMLRLAREHNVPGPRVTAAANLVYALLEVGATNQARGVVDEMAFEGEDPKPGIRQAYWAASLALAVDTQDRVFGRVAWDNLQRAFEEALATNGKLDPSGLALSKSVGPWMCLPESPTQEQLEEAGAALLATAVRETRYMPGYRILAVLSCARVAVRLQHDALALSLIEFGRFLRPADLPVAWAVALEDLAAEIHLRQGDYPNALAATQAARALQVAHHRRNVGSLASALLARSDGDDGNLRAVELAEVNEALRSTTERLDSALKEASAACVRAENAAQARHRFLGRMSHELRTPLQGVLGSVELLRDTGLTSQQRDLVDLLDRSARHSLGIINDILDVGQLEAGRQSILSVPTNVQGVVADAIRTVQPRAAEKGLSVRLVWEDSLPPVVLGDGRRLTQVLLNLLGNAIKFTDAGQVTVSVMSVQGAYEISVRDTGCGIPPESLDSIFEAFGPMVENRPAYAEGAGLGLSIARGIVTAMGGTLVASSTVGEGSTFVARLPLVPASMPPEGPAMEPDVGLGDLSGLRVLLAEDNPVNQLVLRRHLSALGTQVTVVADGGAASEALGTASFDVAILDFHMPVRSGLSVCEGLRRRGSRLPVLGMTASVLPEDEAAARAVGMDAYASKPISRARLHSILSRMVRGLPEQAQ